MAMQDSDPRTLQPAAPTQNVRPVVGETGRGLPLWVPIAGLAALAVLLFVVLDARRRALDAPTADPRIADGPVLSAAPPPLAIPPAPPPPMPAPPRIAPAATETPPPAPSPAPAQPQIIYLPQPAPAPPYGRSHEPTAPPPSGAPALVIDVGAATGPATATGDRPATAGPAPGPSIMGMSPFGGRTRSGMFANRATTIAQGVLIPAVLETALDTSRPGIARAVVSRDVRGFDGSRVLVPRGSQLVGEYRSEIAPGQRRAMINWTRLTRPDGVTIALDSPAGDPLGRGGIGAQAHDDFFARFLGSMLRTGLDVGVALAGGRNQQTVIVANGATAGMQAIPQRQSTRRLTVRPGTSISVLVARDLDFTGAGNGR